MNIMQKLIIRVSMNLIKHCLQSEPIHAFIYMYIYILMTFVKVHILEETTRNRIQSQMKFVNSH